MYGIRDALHWYKKALHSVNPSSDKHIDLVISIVCKIASGYMHLRLATCMHWMLENGEVRVVLRCGFVVPDVDYVREWKTSLFWLDQAHAMDPDNLSVHMYYVRLHEMRGDTEALQHAKDR